jgi:hypothetical protein
MKRIFALLLSLCTIGLVLGQESEDDEIKTLLKKGTKFGGFMGVTVKLADINHYNTVLVGGNMGALFNDNFMLGAGGYGISSTNSFDGKIDEFVSTTQPLYLYGGYGGLILGYKLFPNEIVHVSIPVLIGGGGFEISDIEGNNVNDISINNTVEQTTALVIEPSIEAEVNVTKFFRIAIGGGYRLVQGTNFKINDISDNDLTSWSAHFSLKFGKFW